MACPHIQQLDLRPPRPSQPVYREDCTQCFDSVDSPDGLHVCLSCFNGGCAGQRNHARLHYQDTNHPLALNIRRVRRARRKKQKKDDDGGGGGGGGAIEGEGEDKGGMDHEEEPPQKISKLAIAAETEEDRYETTKMLVCHACSLQGENLASWLEEEKLSPVVDGITNAMTFAKREEVKAWEQEFTPCEHTLCLEQQGSGHPIPSQELGSCSVCGLKENLWLCLECGNLGCGRAQFGGSGGNSHGLAHADASGHGVAVKLGSITPEGSADIYCYKCDEERIDPELAAHLAHWGINLADREKTEKSLMEMQVEQNLKWDFSMTTRDGQELKPLFGPGLTGLKNIGNSCYLASIIQCLFSLPEFYTRYYNAAGDARSATAKQPAEDLETQLRKMADGLLSGRYSTPMSSNATAAATPSPSPHTPRDDTADPTPHVAHQEGLAPVMFKHLIGRGHEEFSTMRQQDAFELLLHLFKLITVSKHTSPLRDPVKSFRFSMEQRLQCVGCRRVRYRTDEQDNISIPVPARRKPVVERNNHDANGATPTTSTTTFEPVTLKECLDIFTAPDAVELRCPACNSEAGFTKQTKFKTFPRNLVINARRFELVNWVPTKLDIPVEVGGGDKDDEELDMTAYQSQGLQQGEELLPEDADVDAAGASGNRAAPAAGTQASFVPNPIALSQLESMGFPYNRCARALHVTGNADAETAMTWLFEHMEDANIDDPLDLGGGADGASNAANRDDQSGDALATPDRISQLTEMGITTPQARKGLRQCDGDVARALDWVFSHPDDPGEGEPSVSQSGTGEPEISINTAADSDTTTPAPVNDRNDQSDSSDSGDGSAPIFTLRSVVCHKGASVHAGHYVAFVKKALVDPTLQNGFVRNDAADLLPSQTGVHGENKHEAVITSGAGGSGGSGNGNDGTGDRWVLFNDEKVVQAGDADADEVKRFAYVYFFRRK